MCLKIWKSRKKSLYLHIQKYVLFSAVIGCMICSFPGFGQHNERKHFNTIGLTVGQESLSASIVSEGNTDCDSTEICNMMREDIQSFIPAVSFPLKRIQISSPFGMRRDPLDKKTRRIHNGLDLKANYEEVYSMLPGTVIRVANSKLAGLYITIDHGICVCSYMHLSQILAKKGEHVHAGQIIAISGNTGQRTTGPHLHIAARWDNEQGKFFDPMLLLSFVSAQLSTNQ